MKIFKQYEGKNIFELFPKETSKLAIDLVTKLL